MHNIDKLYIDDLDVTRFFMEKKIKIGITHGDINGISYEIIIKALADSRINDLCTPIIYGSSKVLNYYKNMISVQSQFSCNVIEKPSNAHGKKVNLINCIDDQNPKIELGISTEAAGKYAVASLNRAITDLKDGEIDVLVTCPINKSNVQSEGFDFVGHTEYLSASFGGDSPLMFMISEHAKIGFVTIHQPLSEVAKSITPELILEKAQLMKKSLVRDFSIYEPKIALLGVNPHAGDNGLLGVEESRVILPAIEAARADGIHLFGPFAADGFFGSEMYKKYDATLAMYHDQGMIPFKLIGSLSGVNYTAGLSVVRTSPAHGVGYDIAGKDLAHEDSLRDAIYAAIDIYRNREIANEIEANPLRTYSRDSWGNSDAYVRDINVPDGDKY